MKTADWKGIALLLVSGLATAVADSSSAQSYVATIISNPNPQTYASQFGRSLARVGDLNNDGIPDFIVGTPFHFVAWNENQGRAYVISGRDGSVLRTVDDPDGQWDGQFGWAVAGIGDVDGDKISDYAVAARYHYFGSAEYVGQVYLFSGRTSALIHRLDNPWPQIYGEFGHSVAGVADIDGDKVPDVLVGAIGYHAPGPPVLYPAPPGFPPNTRAWQGRVYLFSGRDGTLLRTIEHPSPQELSFFGVAVAGARDLNQDKVPDIVVGASGQIVGGIESAGEVYVFSGLDGALIRRLQSPTAQRYGLFGFSLAVRDINHDITPDIIVGSPFEDVGANLNQGRAFLFRGANGALLRSFDHPTPRARTRFGLAVAEAGVVGREKVSGILIGAPGEYMFSDPSIQGTAFVFSGHSGNLLFTLNQPNPQANGLYGYTVASIGDANRDGKADLVVGAPYQDVGGTALQGQAYLFKSRRPWWCTFFPWWC